jgi:hypothetical protein
MLKSHPAPTPPPPEHGAVYGMMPSVRARHATGFNIIAYGTQKMYFERRITTARIRTHTRNI